MKDRILSLIESVIYKDLIWLQPSSGGSRVDLPIVISTQALRHVLQTLLLFKQARISASKDSTIKCQHNSVGSFWEVTIGDCHASVVESILASQMSIEKIRFRGSILNTVQLKGDYANGLITCCPEDLAEFVKSVLSCPVHESIDVFPIESAYQLMPLNKVVSTPSEPSYVTTTMNLPERQVSAILGPNGDTLNSIRFQSKCWIKVFSPVNKPQWRPSKNNLQRIQITGARENIGIAMVEINRICGMAR
ncbi:hypothetical protein Cantr_02043 [Candida viswanathii]|uniref:K Homology domain-containing protein n=1 Tax=Candida viswanathii TaxID=5486 RepID=A0A367YKC9_9ASCO|nr:hypothetical protein Cantr_02043 [Candida viswanathii]